MPKAKPRTCRSCGDDFILTPTKPGHIDDCPNCATDVPLLMAKVAWEGKHFPIIEIAKSRAEAIAFNKAQRRSGPGPMSSIVTPKEEMEGRESSKSGSGSELGAMYHSNLGEKRHLKR